MGTQIPVGAQETDTESPDLTQPVMDPMGTTLRILAVVVTHDRPEALQRCLGALANQTRSAECVLVVDNASGVDTITLLREWPGGVQTLRFDRNVGGAGGFAAGLHWASEHDFDWAWLMDDDAIPENTALAALLPSMRRHRGQLVALASRTTMHPSEHPREPFGEESRIDHAMFVGFAVPKRVVEELGVPRDDFFIYTDDTDYCWRIQRAGGTVFRVPDSIVVHADWAREPRNLVVTIGGRRLLLYPRVARWKKYYLARNRIIAASADSRRRLTLAVLQSLALTFTTAFLAPRDLAMVTRGLFDGLRGRAGARVLPN